MGYRAHVCLGLYTHLARWPAHTCGHMNRHVHGHVYKHVCRHVHKHAYAGRCSRAVEPHKAALDLSPPPQLCRVSFHDGQGIRRARRARTISGRYACTAPAARGIARHLLPACKLLERARITIAAHLPERTVTALLRPSAPRCYGHGRWCPRQFAGVSRADSFTHERAPRPTPHPRPPVSFSFCACVLVTGRYHRR